MQPLNGAPRESLTAEQVMWLIQDSPAMETDHGLELIDQNLELIEDISGDCAGGSVSRNSYATLHGTASLAVTRDLDWGTAIVRPYMTMTDGLISARFNLGAYFTSKPEELTGEDPTTIAVTGFDILDRLNDDTGSAYAIPAGTSYVTAIEQIFTEQGYTRWVMDPAAADKVLPSAYVSPLADEKTWLGIVNDLLAAIGYAGVWSDWDGQLRCHPYQSPADREVEWVYDVESDTSIIAPDRRHTQDLYRAPNRWVFVRNGDIDGPAPVEGNGIYTFENQSTGPTSIDARDGRVITRPLRVDAADQAALVARAQVTIDADMRIPHTIRHKGGPNPLHWHFDRVVLNDAPAGATWADILVTGWTLPLDGSDMDHEWTVI